MRRIRPLLVAASAALVMPQPLTAQSSQVHVEQVPEGLASGRLESELLKEVPQGSAPSESPLNLQYRLTDTPAPGVLRPGSDANIRQDGAGNDANADIDGDNNSTNQIQRGDRNSSNITIDGDNKTVVVGQFGNDNTSDVGLQGSQPQSVLHIQDGNGLTRPKITTDAPHIEIRQR